MEPQTTDSALLEKAGQAAARLLEKRGYEIVERGWRCEEGGFDLIASRDGAVMLAQVVAREGNLADFRDADSPERKEGRELAARRYLEERGMKGADACTELIGVHMWGTDRAIVHCWPDKPEACADRKPRDDGRTR